MNHLKCDTANRVLCRPMLAHTMGKFADETLKIISRINPETGKEDFIHSIALVHPGAKKSLLDRLPTWVQTSKAPKNPMPLELNFCPWCGASLNREQPKV